MATRHWLQLAMTSGLGPILTRRLIDFTATSSTSLDQDGGEPGAGSAEAACNISAADLRQIEGIGSRKGDAIYRSLQEAAARVDSELKRSAALGVMIVSPDDQAYPVLLRSIPDPPCVLYVRGELQPRDLNGFAVVGSRKCSHYGREQADRFGALLAGAGFTILSGGARGTDSAAHRGALSHPQGRTIAVLGSGVDIAYPPENAGLFEQIAKRGAVVSEYPLGTPPLADNFPRRNRIISGMARGVLVTESAERSGALITARQAADDHGRPVFAMPGRIDNPMAAGPHQLLRDGAILTAGLDDILHGLGPLPAEAHEPTLFSGPIKPVETPATPPPPTFALSARQQLILKALDHEEANVDRLIELTSLDASIVLQELTFLTLKGLVKRVDGQTFARRR